jgi:anaerobic magnesium-protoporphyrin IX monomethyl ester cyclase
MKVLLTNPPLSGIERYGALAEGGVYLPNLGLGYLASSIMRNDHVVRILDCEALSLSLEEATSAITRWSPDVVGITAVTISIHSAAALAQSIKRTGSHSTIVLGGPHVTATPEETLRLYQQFDVCILGEGEITLVELLNALQGGRDLREVDGIAYLRDGEVLKTRPRALIKDLDTLPFPAWELYPDLARCYRPSAFGFKKLPSTSIITSRGCPSTCSFCNQQPWGRSYREHSAEYTLEMIRILYTRYGIRDLAVYDGTFGVNTARLVKLCELLIAERLDLAWSCNFRVSMADPEVLSLMKRAGCWSIAFGVESGSQRILDFLHKGITLPVIQQAMRNTKDAGIITKAYIMVGTPLESKKTLDETREFILGLDLDILTVNHFTPFPGTLDFKRAHQLGTFNPDWKLLSEHNTVFTPRALRKEDVESFITEITRRFYLRPRIIANFIKLSFNITRSRLLARGVIAFARFIFRQAG